MTKLPRLPILIVFLLLSSSLKAAESVVLKPQWPVGKKITHHVDRLINFQMSGAMMPETKYVTNISQDVILSVIGKSAQGGWIIDYKALSIKIDVTGAFNGSFDSADKPSTDAGNKLAPAREMTKSTIRYHLDASNTIFKTEGLTEQFAAVKSKMAPPSGGFGGAMGGDQQFLNGFFTQDLIRRSFEIFLPEGFSDKAVKPGKSWNYNRSETDPATGTLDYKTKFTFKEWQVHGNKKYAFINVEGTIGSPPGQKGKSATGLPTTVSGGKLATNILFDPALGIIVTQRGYLDVPTSIDISSMMGGFGGGGDAAIIKLKVRDEVTTTLKKVK